MDMQQFLADRDEALLSMDLGLMRMYMRRYGEAPPDDDETLVVSIHMARTAVRSLPMRERIISKKWLTKRGLRTLDEGEVPEELED